MCLTSLQMGQTGTGAQAFGLVHLGAGRGAAGRADGWVGGMLAGATPWHAGNDTRFQSSEEVASICACRSSGIDRKGENAVEEDIQV